jgi:hypothetical protein
MKTKQILTMVTAIIFGIVFTACDKKNGNGQVTSETRQLESFSKVEVAGAYSVFISHDSKSEVRIEAESNLIQYIRTDVSNGVLIIDNSQNIDPDFEIKIYIKTPELNALLLSGSGVIEADSLVGSTAEVIISGSGLINTNIIAESAIVQNSGSGALTLAVDSQTLLCNLSGSGYANLSGNADNGNFVISASGSIDAFNLTLNELDATISGSGNMGVSVLDFLKVLISGSGSLTYSGDPDLDVNITGSGSINKI